MKEPVWSRRNLRLHMDVTEYKVKGYILHDVSLAHVKHVADKFGWLFGIMVSSFKCEGVHREGSTQDDIYMRFFHVNLIKNPGTTLYGIQKWRCRFTNMNASCNRGRKCFMLDILVSYPCNLFTTHGQVNENDRLLLWATIVHYP